MAHLKKNTYRSKWTFLCSQLFSTVTVACKTGVQGEGMAGENPVKTPNPARQDCFFTQWVLY